MVINIKNCTEKDRGLLLDLAHYLDVIEWIQAIYDEKAYCIPANMLLVLDKPLREFHIREDSKKVKGCNGFTDAKNALKELPDQFVKIPNDFIIVDATHTDTGIDLTLSVLSFPFTNVD